MPGTELAKAYVQIIPSAEGIKGKLTEALGGEADAAGSAAGNTAGSAFGKIFKGVAAVGVAAVGAAATSVGALTKSAVESYAEYQQLVGGLETMFQDLSGDVEANASRAFQTAGLSANEYMETVMGFSASLNASLLATEGDISRAADLSDQIITDMADNANKMGSSMDSIQNAYSGFAKQNYTMLDNLKLGYGGTRTEMERLLADAEKLSGVEYSIDNFSDVAEAIHVIQSEMGITGTTALEASSTISGSLSSMKSAWANLVTGFASGNADIQGLIGNLIGSAETAFSNLLPVVETAMAGIASGVEMIAPVIAERLPGVVESVVPPLLGAATSLVNAVVAALPSLVQVLVDTAPSIIESLINSVLTMLPQVIALGLTLLVSIANGIAANLPTLIPTIVDVVLQIVDTITNPETLSALVDASIAIIVALANGLIASLPKLLEQAPIIIANLVTAVIQNAPKLLSAALEVIVQLVGGITQNLFRIGEAAGSIITSLLQGLAGVFASMWEVGGQIVQGVWQGIQAWASWLWENVTNFFSGIVNGVKNALGIASPSKVFAGIGENMALGVGVGIEDNLDVVEQAVGEMSAAALGAWEADSLSATVASTGAHNFGAAGVSGSDTGVGGSSVSALAEAIIIALNGCGVYMDGALVGNLVTRAQANTARANG